MNLSDYLTLFVGEDVGFKAIENKMSAAGFQVLGLGEHKWGWRVYVETLGVDMQGMPQSDLENRLQRVGLRLMAWTEIENYVIVQEIM